MIAQLVLGGVLAAAPQSPLEAPSFADATNACVTLDEPGVLYLVDFWVLGCAPCMIEMPELEKLAREYEPSGRFRLISVLWGEWSGAKLREMAKLARTGLPVYSDPENWLERHWEARFPTKVLMRDGVVLRHVTGGGQGAYAKWSKIVAKELEEP